VALEHIFARMTRLADIIEMDAKQEATKQNAKAIKALVELAKNHIAETNNDHTPRTNA
jgi:hypothetical protein